MADEGVTGDQPLAAGDFSAWLTGMRHALLGDGGSEVPCGGCTACCTSSQFVHIEPDEADTRAHIPAQLLFPAPRMPAGHVLLGYDGNGHCPMLVDGACSIYEHRPRACRTYDCRVFPATGVEPDEDQIRVARQARRWRFSFPAEVDRTEYDALRTAATLVREPNATQRAVLAIRRHAGRQQ